MTLCCASTTGCIKFGGDRLKLVRTQHPPEEAQGFAQVVEAKGVKAAILGAKESPVGDVDMGPKKKYPVLVDGKIKEIDATGMLLLWMEDVAAFVKNTNRLSLILKDPDLAKLIKEKGL
jgi:hypothetical protein